MCLGLVMKVEKIENNEAACSYLGNIRNIRIDFINDVKIGDYLLIHAGFAISRLAKDEGEERMNLFKELEEKIKEV